jgi:hypothetical protein
VKKLAYKSRVSLLRLFKFTTIIAVLATSCLDFQFESGYEDINGIYVEHVYSYNYLGTKLLFNGSIGYMVNADSLLVYDFTDMDSVILLGYCGADFSINDFQIYDDYAILVTDLTMEIVDLRDSLPNHLSVLSAFAFASSIRVHEENAYIACSDELYVVDISDKQNPALISSLEFGEQIIQVEIDSNLAYVLVGTDFTILDIQNPNALTIIASTSLPPLGIFNPEAFCKKNAIVYFAGFTSYNASLSACTLTTDSDLHVLDQIVVPDRIHQFHVSDAYTLAVCWFDAYLLNLQHSSSPCISELIGGGGIHGIIKENRVYILTPFLEVFEIKQVEQ